MYREREEYYVEQEHLAQEIEQQAHDDVDHALKDACYDRFNDGRQHEVKEPLHQPIVSYWAGGSSED